MSVERIWKIPNQSLHIGHETEREYTDTLYCRCNDWRDTRLTVYMHKDCPKKGDRHPEDNLAYVDEIDINRIGNSKFHWEIVLKYTTVREENQDEPDPLKEIPEIDLQTQSKMEEIYTDIYGEPITNTAGDPIQGIEIEVFNWKINASRNIPPNFPDFLLNCKGRINIAPVRIRGLEFPKETLRLRNISVGKIDQKNDVSFSVLATEMEYDERTHRKRVLNTGFSHLSPILGTTVNGKWKPLKERILINGEPPADPVFLDNNGHRIHEIKKIKGVDTVVYKDAITAKDVIVLEKEVYLKMDFKVFDLS
ncbi:MAG: hypothetical protein V4719_10060 [Planctomycetota bacterium]